MLGSKGILPPTDTNKLLRCDATFAILKTFGFADFSKKQLTRAYHAQNCPVGLNRFFEAVLLMKRRSFLAQHSEKNMQAGFFLNDCARISC